MNTDRTVEDVIEKYNVNLQNFYQHCYKHTSVSIFGSGSYAKRIAKILKKNNIHINFFFDNNPAKANSELEGIPVVYPNDNIDLLRRFPIIIASTWHEEISTQLIDIDSYLHTINASEFDYEMNIHFLDTEDEKHLLWLYYRIQDEDSKKLFINLLRYRSSGEFKYLPKSSFSQYLHPFLSLTNNEIIIDGGAWQGDTAEFFLNKFQASKVISLEPDPQNYTVLQGLKNIYKERLIHFPYGLWDKRTTLYFNSTDVLGDEHSIGCSISDQGDIKIEVEALDALVSQLDIIPSYIKMDIEGAEYEAILGASQTIKQHKPKLAICLYHKPKDLWQLPKLIHQIRDDYSFSLGHHFHGWTETVLYAY